MATRAAGSETGAQPGTKNRDHDEKGCACEQCIVRRDPTFYKVAGEKTGKDWVREDDEYNGKDVAADDDPDGLKHGLRLPMIAESRRTLYRSFSKRGTRCLRRRSARSGRGCILSGTCHRGGPGR